MVSLRNILVEAAANPMLLAVFSANTNQTNQPASTSIKLHQAASSCMKDDQANAHSDRD